MLRLIATTMVSQENKCINVQIYGNLLCFCCDGISCYRKPLTKTAGRITLERRVVWLKNFSKQCTNPYQTVISFARERSLEHGNNFSKYGHSNSKRAVLVSGLQIRFCLPNLFVRKWRVKNVFDK